MPSSGCQTCALDRKSTRLNSSHTIISYAVFCLKKKKGGVARDGGRRPRREGWRQAAGRAPAERSGLGRAARPVTLAQFEFRLSCSFFFNERAPPQIYPLSLPDALPI